MSEKWIIYILLQLLAATCIFACDGTVYQTQLALREGANLPCGGIARLRVEIFLNSSEESIIFDSWGGDEKFYNIDGTCNLPQALPLTISSLPLAESLWIRVEGFDSTESRRICLGKTDFFTMQEIAIGELGELVLDREPVLLGPDEIYTTTTLEIQALEGIEDISNNATMEFTMNTGPGEPENQFSGGFVKQPGTSWADAKLNISNILPRDSNDLLIVARENTTTLVGQWRNSSFDVLDTSSFLKLVLAKQ